jgi:hypothetical protein
VQSIDGDCERCHTARSRERGGDRRGNKNERWRIVEWSVGWESDLSI